LQAQQSELNIATNISILQETLGAFRYAQNPCGRPTVFI